MINATLINTTAIVLTNSTVAGGLTATSSSGDISIPTGVTVVSTGGNITLRG